MSSRRLLILAFIVAPLSVLGGCGGASLSDPNSNTQAGLGTLIVKVRTDNARTLVRILNKTLGNTIAYVTNGSAIFYNVTPAKYDIEVTTPRSIEPIYSEGTVVADRTTTLRVESPSDYVTPTPFFLKK